MATDGNKRQLDLFVATLTDLPLRDQRETMERPFFSLSKAKRIKPIIYESRDTSVKVTSGAYGMATIWDADILIWAASQINEAQEKGLATSRVIHVHPYDLLRSIRRGTGKDHYDRLRDALRRLQTTSIETNIRAKGKKRLAQFSWIESWGEVISEKTGRSDGMRITLSEWFYDGVLDQKLLLAIPGDYFSLTGGIERWLFRVVRKHAGKQPSGWACPVTTLYEKSGSTQRQSDFNRDLRKIVEADRLPEYHLELNTGETGDVVLWVIRRDKLHPTHPASGMVTRRRRDMPL